SESRSRYIRQIIAAQGDASESLDEKIYSAVKKQAKLKGLIYESESASY
ncbi:MAG: VWA domain-containing protein, partial [Proteobacteria bacterium]|nr:VWA domain-containing protein [Pseudomonadota bacterium]